MHILRDFNLAFQCIEENFSINIYLVKIRIVNKLQYSQLKQKLSIGLILELVKIKGEMESVAYKTKDSFNILSLKFINQREKFKNLRELLN